MGSQVSTYYTMYFLTTKKFIDLFFAIKIDLEKKKSTDEENIFFEKSFFQY